MRALSNLAFLLGTVSIASAQGVQYGHNHVVVRKDTDNVARNFPAVDVPLLSPAFLSPQDIPDGFSAGTAGPTDDSTLDSFIKSLAEKNDWISYNVANFSSEEGRAFPYLLLSSSPRNPCRTANSTQKPRVWLQGAVHGNEPAGDQAVLALLGKMDANQTWAASLLKRVEILVLPRYNLDGVAYFQRTLATNLDPNRDHVKLARQQTRDIKQLFSSFAPHVAIDMHEYSATTQYGRYVQGADGLFSAAKNLNIHPTIRRLSEKLFAPAIGEAMEDLGLTWEPYVTGPSSSKPDFTIRFDEAGSDAKIGRNAMGLTQSITFLCETRGIRLADQHFQRRTVSGLAMAESIIQTAADHADEVYSTIEDGIRDFIASTEDIIVTDYSTLSKRTFTMVDSSNGSVVQVPIEFASTTPVNANLTRGRPEAYLIPVAWADLADRLRVSGLEVETLQEPFRGSVEALKITSVAFADEYYEGVVRVDVTTETVQKELELPSGSFLISTRQKNAALAVVALEPENIDSYVSFNIVPVDTGDEYPIFRIMS